MTRANGLHPVAPAITRPPPGEHTKLLTADEVELLEVKESLHTKHAGLVALFGKYWGVGNAFGWWVYGMALLTEWWLLSYVYQAAIQFNKPFFIVCFNHTATIVLLPVVFGYYRVCGSPEDRLAGLDIAGVLQRHSVVPLPKLMRIAAFLSAFYCVADYFWYAALANVSVAAGTAIFNCSPLFVYCFSICFLHEHLSVKKLCGVLTSFVGVTLIVMFQDGSDLSAMESTSLVAGLLVVISAALYGGYEVALRLAVGEDITDTATLLTMTGLSGLFSIPLWIVGSLLLTQSPFPSLYESLGFPAAGEGLLLLMLTGGMAVVFSVFLPLSLCWTSPLETSVGCMLTIPLSGVMDTFIHHTSFSWECIVGSALVMGGFGILEYSSSTPLLHRHHTHEEQADTSIA